MEGGLRKQLWASGASVRMAEQMDQGDGPIVPELQTRLFTLLARTLLDAGEPVEPPSQLITDWVHEKKSKLIEVWAGIKPEDPHYQNLYDHPIQAIILYSKLCQNWWCGAAAVCIFELLATKFGGVRVWAQRYEIEYEEALRDMTNGIMYAHRNGASMWPNRLNAEDESGGSIKVISTTLGGLLDQGRITEEEHTYFASDLTVKRLIKEINDVITLLGGYKMAEAFKWWMHGQNRPTWDYLKLDWATRDKPGDTRDALERVKGCTEEDLNMVRYLFGEGMSARVSNYDNAMTYAGWDAYQ